MKIKSIKAAAIDIPQIDLPKDRTTEPLRPSWVDHAEVANPMSRFAEYKANRKLWQAPWKQTCCVVTAEDGTFGVGMTSFAGPVCPLINDYLGPRLEGRDCMAIERHWDMMFRLCTPMSPMGLASYAISAVDLALWDLKGKLLRQPVFALLGGPTHDALRCYATGNDTEWHMDCGFKATKLACPYGPADGLAALDGNEALVAKARETIGSGVELMLDCWMAFDVEFAVRLAERLRPYALKWMEDCVLPEDVEGFIELRRRVPYMGLATGEHWYMPQPFFTACSRRVADILQPDVMWMGGLTGFLKVAHLAEAAGIGVIPHAGMNDAYGQHAAFAISNTPWGEFFVGSAPGVPLDEAPTRRSPGRMAVPQEGMIVPCDGHGFGLELELDTLNGMLSKETQGDRAY